MPASTSVPPELLYTLDHMWVRVEGQLLRVGITHYGQAALGDVISIDIPNSGVAVSVGNSFGWVESIKSVVDVFPPVSGRVCAANAELKVAPGSINRNPYGAGWICVIDPSDPDEMSALLNAEGYRRLVGEED